LWLSLYADDVALFINPTKADVDMTMQIIHQFGLATGLKINTGKSIVVPLRCSQVNLDDVLQSFDGTRVGFPITYLGLPITIGCLRIAHM
jgi:hypothetical protein